MLKIRQCIAGLMAATVLVSSTTPADAKKKTQGVGSLGEMSCQNIEDGRYDVINRDFPVGLQIFRGIAMFRDRTGDRISKNLTNQVACRLTEAGQKPTYKTLNLAFAIDDNNDYANGSLVRLSIYQDGKFYKYQDVTKGEQFRLPIDITSVRSIALEAECLRGSVRNKNTCPALIFFEDSLQ
ncbi:MAG: hypothetical protein ACKPCG_06440 [Dolichospermum sp.]